MLGPAAALCAQPIMAPTETPNARYRPSLRKVEARRASEPSGRHLRHRAAI